MRLIALRPALPRLSSLWISLQIASLNFRIAILNADLEREVQHHAASLLRHATWGDLNSPTFRAEGAVYLSRMQAIDRRRAELQIRLSRLTQPTRQGQ